MAVYKEEKTELGGQFIAIPIGMVSGNRPKRGASRPSERRRHGSGNSSTRPAPTWI